jgi:hypothetical protein
MGDDCSGTSSYPPKVNGDRCLSNFTLGIKTVRHLTLQNADEK